MAQKTLSAGQYEAYGYDTRGRATAIALKNSSGTVLRTQSYAYDLSSKITSHTLAGVATSYGYDGAGQLLTEGRTGYSGSYTYDGNGNRLTRSVNGTAETYAYDDGDKLGSVSVGGSAVKTYGYDAAGRATSVLSSVGTTTLAYDYEGRATSISGPGVSQTNAYNGLDTRVGSTTNSVASTYLRDGASVTDAVLKDGVATYTPGISERRGSATTFSHPGLKNDDAQTTTAQTVSATRQYDAFGNVMASSGMFVGPFGFGGAQGYQEDATGLKLLGHRLYDSSTGRFLTRDPVMDGRNWYVYCGNDPVGRADPSGLSFWKEADDRWVTLSENVLGRDDVDRNGNPVRIGGWPSMLFQEDNAVTVNGTVHVNDEGKYQNYLRNKWKQNHEEYHIIQDEANGSAQFWKILLIEYAQTYLTGGGHDDVPTEQEANNYANGRPLGSPDFSRLIGTGVIW